MNHITEDVASARAVLKRETVLFEKGIISSAAHANETSKTPAVTHNFFCNRIRHTMHGKG
jgi:hypothetical protein